VATGNGDGVMPAFRPSRPGVYIMAITNVQTGQTQYIKVRTRR
jgi:hypothetical protein